MHHTPKTGKISLTGPRLDTALRISDEIRFHHDQIARLELRQLELVQAEHKARSRPDRTALGEMVMARAAGGHWQRAMRDVAAQTGLAYDIVASAYHQHRKDQKQAIRDRAHAEIVRRWKAGESQAAIAAATGYSRAWVSQIVAREVGPRSRK